MNIAQRNGAGLARNVRRLGHLDLPGAGQVTIAGSHAFVGHITNQDRLGTSIIEVTDPHRPRLVATITLDDPESHSHKARVASDIMIVNHERNMSRIGRRAEQLPAARRELTEKLGREPTPEEIASRINITVDDLRAAEEFERRGYRQRRLQDLRRFQPGAAEADLLSTDRRPRRASFRHGRALRLHLDRDGRLHRQYPRRL